MIELNAIRSHIKHLPLKLIISDYKGTTYIIHVKNSTV